MIEIPLKTSGWDDENGEFDETLYLHFVNLGWEVMEDRLYDFNS